MFEGVYLRRVASGHFKKELMALSYFLERVAIDYQFSRDGNYILNLQGGSLLGVFVAKEISLNEVISSVEDDYNFIIKLV
jgi:hypothetical protein